MQAPERDPSTTVLWVPTTLANNEQVLCTVHGLERVPSTVIDVEWAPSTVKGFKRVPSSVETQVGP